ncbi:MAG: transglycosylase domain-containing protein [Bacteroidetes bacterium]|nr:transglycosylase domain-containing protein [Bacteroidota bacterium]
MGNKKEQPRYKKLLVFFWLIVLLPFVALSSIILIASKGWIGEPLPSFEELENPKSNLASEIVSSDQLVIGKYYVENRTNVHYNELSPNLVKALKATEDIRFEEHSGVDLRGLLRAVFRAGTAGGGSTITQQLAKNLFHEKPDTKLKRIIQKFQEWIIAVRLERNYTKEEIMAMYLNTVEFSSNAYGIKSACRTYFNKTPDMLNVQEASILVGMLQAPTRYNPVLHPKNSLERRNTVLAQLRKYDFITEHQHDSLKALPIQLHYQSEDHNYGVATHFRESLRADMLQWCKDHRKADGHAYNLYTDGLRIYTTIDSRMQRYAEEAMREHLTELQRAFNIHWKGREPWAEHKEIITDAMHRTERYATLKDSGRTAKEIEKNFNTKVKMTIFSWRGDIDTMMTPLDSIKYYKKILQSGFMSMEPQTGFVRAWVGGLDYRYFKYDHVKEGKRQVGSTFKAFLYTLAMQEGYSPCYKVPNVKITIDMPPPQPPWTPVNADGKYGGMMTLKYGLAESVNCLSAYLMKQFGPQAMIDMARRMGITSPIDAVPSICLGSCDLSVYELVGAYATFANKGVWTEPIYISRIEDKNGNVLQDFVPKKVEAISEETAYLMLNLLQGVIQFGTGARLRGQYKFTNPIAGKTGTTQNQSDGWFMGLTPNLVSGCWVGCEDRIVHFRTLEQGQGARTAMPIWALFMQKVYADQTLNLFKGDFEKPSTPISVELDCDKYKQPGEDEKNPERNF